MAVEKLIPEHEIPDNDEQLRILEEMLQDQREARVYLIRDARIGCGKTLLLRKLHWTCQTVKDPARRLVATVIDLEDYQESSPYHLIRTIAEKTELPLGEYERLQVALEIRNPVPFIGAAVASTVDLRDATISDHAQVATIIVNTAPGGHVHVPAAALPQWNEDLRPRAERMIIQAFFDDLRGLPDNTRVAIFIDSVDAKARSSELKRWVVENLVEKVFLDVNRRPKNVILCVAGRDLADYPQRIDRAEMRLAAPQLLTTWQEKHTEQFFRFMLQRELPAMMLNAIHQSIVNGQVSLARARAGAEMMFALGSSDE